MKRTGSGFTIVELLIVIVVIAILAAITIVSYNNITARAKNSQLLSTVDAYTKAFQLYKAQNGAYPAIVSGETQSSFLACLGTAADFPAKDGYQSGSCYRNASSSSSTYTSTTLTSNLASVVNSLPAVALPTYHVSATNEDIRGILYYSAPPSLIMLEYLLEGDKECGRGNKSYDTPTFPGMTLCVIPLN